MPVRVLLLVESSATEPPSKGKGMKRPPKTLEMMLYDLVESGHRPSLYLRDALFRAHVDAGGSSWGDDELPDYAMQKAIDKFVELHGSLRVPV